MAQTLEFSTQFSNHIPEDDQTTTWKDCSNSVSRPSPVASQHASASKMHSSIVEDGPLRFRDELPNDLTEDVSADPIVITPTFGSISASPAWRWFNKYLFIISLLLGIAISACVAVAHLLFFYFLDNKAVSNTVSQEVVSTVSVGLTRLFGMVMTVTLSNALAQLVWRYLRRRSLRLSTVDSLFNLCTHFISLSLPHAILHAPAMTTLAVVIAFVPIAMIFPPGAITVNLLPSPGRVTLSVPSWDASARPTNFAQRSTQALNSTTIVWASDIPNQEIGLSDDQGSWAANNGALIAVERLQALGEVVPAKSPCGQNCSYVVTFPTPGYSCSPENHINLTELLWPDFSEGFEITYKQLLETNIFFIAGQNYSTAVINGTKQDVIRLDIQWGYEPIKQNLSCIYYQNFTTTNVTYINGQQSFARILYSYGKPISPHALASPHYIGQQLSALLSAPNSTIAKSLTPSHLATLNIFGLTQALAITLEGFVFRANDTTQGSGLNANNVLLPPGAGDHIVPASQFPISESLMQEMIFNVSLSYMNTYPNIFVETTVHTNNWANTYVFRSAGTSQQWRLYAPYLATLIFGAIILAAGLLALWDNGISAECSFLQVLVTTAAADERVRAEASACSRGGYESFTKELRDLRVRFGDVGLQRDGRDSEGRDNWKEDAGRAGDLMGFRVVEG